MQRLPRATRQVSRMRSVLLAENSCQHVNAKFVPISLQNTSSSDAFSIIGRSFVTSQAFKDQANVAAEAGAEPVIPAVKKADLNMSESAIARMELVNELVDQLQRVTRKDFNNINQVQLMTAMKLAKSLDYALTPSHALTLLGMCGSTCRDAPKTFRMKAARNIWDGYEKAGVQLDISHYNTMIKVMYENDLKDVNPFEYLEMIEKKNLKPNRFTYQLLVTLYCNQGDMTGATTILEHMKTEGIPINELIFYSLIKGHSMNGNTEAVDGVFEIMKDMGVEVGVRANVSLLKGMIRGGKNWTTEVLPKLQEFIAAPDHGFYDSDFLGLAKELADKADFDACSEIVEMLPRKHGLWKAVMEVIPQLIYSGAYDAALKLTKDTLQLPEMEGAARKERSEETNGIPIIRACARHKDMPIEKTLEILSTVYQANSKAIIIYAIEALRTGRVAHVLQVVESAKVKIDVECMALNKWESPFITSLSRSIEGDHATNTFDFLWNFYEQRQPNKIRWNIAKNLVFNDDPCYSLALKYTKNHENNHRALIFNFQEFLRAIAVESGNIKQLFRAELTILSGNFYWPPYMLQVFARNINIDEVSKESFFNILVSMTHGLRIKEKHDQTRVNEKIELCFGKLSSVYNIIEDRGFSGEEFLSDLLVKMKEHDVFLPEKTAADLKEKVKDENIIQMLDDLSKDYAARSLEKWTPSEVAKWKQERKKITGKQRIPEAGVQFEGYQSGGRYRNKHTGNERAEARKRAVASTNVHEIMDILEKYPNEWYSTWIMESIARKLNDAGHTGVATEFVLNNRKTPRGEPNLRYDFIKLFVQRMGWSCSVESLRRFYQVIQPDMFIRHENEQRDNFNINTLFSNTLQNLAFGADQNKIDEALKVLRAIGEEKNFWLKAEDKVNGLKELFQYVTDGGEENFNKVIEMFETDDKLMDRIPSAKPFAFIILSKLVGAKDSNNLQRFVNVMSRSMGYSNTMTNLLLILLNQNRVKQARKILDMPNAYNPANMIYHLNVLSVHENSEELMKFYVCNTPSHGNIERGYNYVINHARNPDTINELWLNTQERGISLSDGPKRALGLKMESFGLQVPFDIPPASPAQAQRKYYTNTRPRSAKKEEVETMTSNFDDHDSSGSDSSDSDSSDDEKETKKQ